MDNNILDDKNINQLGLGIVAALLIHAVILMWLSLPNAQKIMPVDILSAPTNISIRFLTPDKPKPVIEAPIDIPKVQPVTKKTVKPKPVHKKVVKRPIKKVKTQTAKTLNKIAPAAAASKPIQQKVTEAIQRPSPPPIISETKVKGRRVQPQYPKRALRLRQEGVVWLHVLISETGKREKIKMHKPAQYALLNQAAMKAVKKWTFTPYIVNGHAIKTWVKIPIEFKIQ